MAKKKVVKPKSKLKKKPLLTKEDSDYLRASCEGAVADLRKLEERVTALENLACENAHLSPSLSAFAKAQHLKNNPPGALIPDPSLG